MDYREAYEKLKEIGQEHLLRYYEELDPDAQKKLLFQIENIDFTVLDHVIETSERGCFEPCPALTVSEIENHRAEYEEEGISLLKAGKVAAVLLAGGQGTRLGFHHPKGMYNIGKTHDVFIFQRIIENLREVTDLYGPLYLCIMTSTLNRAESESFFKEHDYFGYDPSYIRFFVQDMAPCTDFSGKVLLEEKGKIAESPNGNGGWFSSLYRSGLVSFLKEKGVTYLTAFGVDNVLQKINDPAFIGAVAKSGCDCGGKVVVKNAPDERVGVFCLEDGRPSIVEYYEMTDEMIHLCDERGHLLYAYGVILNYCFRLDKLEKLFGSALPVHRVKKKIPYLNDAGEFVEPDTPNGCKYELLILDLIHIFDTCLPYEVLREAEFAPVKNATGIDSVESARELLEKTGYVL